MGCLGPQFGCDRGVKTEVSRFLQRGADTLAWRIGAIPDLAAATIAPVSGGTFPCASKAHPRNASTNSNDVPVYRDHMSSGSMLPKPDH